MKKIIILLLLLLTGCTKIENNVVTIINENDSCISSITYPITEEKKLNKNIKKYIKKINSNFKKNYCVKDTREELNIDFKKNTVNDNYINITLTTSINETELVKTFIYNKEKNKLITIFDILTENDIKILIEKIKIELKNKNIENNIINDLNIYELPITFNEENLTTYINLNKSLKIEIPIENFDLKIKIKNKENTKNTYTYKEINKIINPNNKIIALTFDDGPSKYTKKIVELLNEYDANATFFILGNKVEIYNETLKYLLDSGNEIGNHSYNHKWLTHVTQEELLNQINTTQDIIKNTLNYTPKLFRPTYGSVNKEIKENIKLDIILWHIDTLDWKYKNANKIATKLLPKIKDGKIVLMHDTYEYTYNALKIILPKLKEEGYQFVTVSELQEVNKIRKIK